ncbi:MAG: hypothetical protein R6W70_07305 [bacterium]
MEDRRNRPEFEKSPTKWRYNLIKAFFTFWRTVKMYGGENDRIDENLENMTRVLDFFLKGNQSDIFIKFDGIDIIVDKFRIRGRRQEDKHFEDLYDLMLSVCLAEVRFERGVSSEEILKFFRAIGKMPVGKEPKVEQFEKFKNFLGDLKNIKVKAYDPEEAGNLPLFSNEQKIMEIFRNIQSELFDQQELAATGEELPFLNVELELQALISILTANTDGRAWDFAIFLSSLNTYRKHYFSTRTASRIFLAISTAITAGLSDETAKQAGISVFYENVFHGKNEGFKKISNMERFNISRVCAATAILESPGSFSEDALIEKSSASKKSSIIAELINTVSFYDTLTHQKPGDKKSPTISTLTALRKVLDRSKKGLFIKDLAESLVRATGVMPPGSIYKIRQTDKYAVPARRFLSFNDESEVFILNNDLNPVSLEKISGDKLADIPDSSPQHIPPESLSKIISAFVK